MLNRESINNYGMNVFDDLVMQSSLPKSTYRAYKECIEKGEPLTREVATAIANAMKIWALEKGATHFTHWFLPMTGLNAEKHDAFLELDGDTPVLEFSGKTLRKGESDASSFPSGGLRATFEARGYTSWDATSHAFVKNNSLYIPTVFCSYNGEALDMKTPLLKSMDVLSRAVARLAPYIGLEDVKGAKAYVGAEQEYFLVPDEYYQKRMDLKLCGRTLFGAKAPKGQEMDDHYFGSIKRRVQAFMEELDTELWKYAIPSKTKHNEAAPAQHEVACIFRNANITCDNNQLLMQLMQDIAKKHGLRCLLHEKPFAGVNGSGKHNNYSIITDTGLNLCKENFNEDGYLPFFATLACIVKGVDEFSDLLRVTCATAANDLRLGALEAPPAIISMYLGSKLNDKINAIIEQKNIFNENSRERFNAGVAAVCDFTKDDNDRNRTSPMAFTGNKFEFRTLGSSQSIAALNTFLNTIIAYEMNNMCDMIDSGMDALSVIRTFFDGHKRILFDGDGYSEEWIQEALRRGLPNRKNTVEALEHFLDEDNVNMLSGMGVYTVDELRSRKDILLENYAKTIHVEATTALRMAQSELYPACLRSLSENAASLLSFEKCGLECSYLREDVEDYNAHLSKANLIIKELEKALDEYNCIGSDNHAKARFAHDTLLENMNMLRIEIDYLEELTDNNNWPIPDYVDLMFGV